MLTLLEPEFYICACNAQNALFAVGDSSGNSPDMHLTNMRL